MTAARREVDVAIIGYGPVGACAAALLGQRGWRVAVVEREPGIYHQPRAAHFDAEVMRVFQSIGVADALLPHIQPVLGMHFVRADGTKIFGFDAPPAQPQGWPSGFMFTQPDLERVLRDRVAELPSVEVHLCHEVREVVTDGDGAVVRAAALDGEGRETGGELEIAAAWVIGCDGGRSMARRVIGTDLEDLGLHQPWLVVDALLTRPVDLPDVNLQICEPDRPTTYIRMPREWRRWEFMLMPGDTPEQMPQPDRVWDLLSPWIGPDDATLVRHVVYTFHALLATRWRDGRVLLAGDAAHQMPPFLGQGMCAGVRDAANLAWKLDLVLAGAAGEALLDTYQPERSAHVRSIIELAVFLGSVIQTTDEAAAAQRDRDLADRPPPTEPRMPGIGPGLVDLDDADHAVGRPAPQPVAADGTRWDDVVGCRFVLLGDVDLGAPRDAETAARWEAWGACDVGEPPEPMRPWLAEHGARGAVIRPDRITLGFVRNPGDLARLTHLATRALTASPQEA